MWSYPHHNSVSLSGEQQAAAGSLLLSSFCRSMLQLYGRAGVRWWAYVCLPAWPGCRVGFNSVYHLTDLPTFVSGAHLVIFDPHCSHLPNVSSTNPGALAGSVRPQPRREKAASKCGQLALGHTSVACPSALCGTLFPQPATYSLGMTIFG